MQPQTNKVALVTGASGGIGRAVATRLARDGFAVVVHYAGNGARASQVVQEIKAGGGQAIAVRADVADATQVERLFKETADAFGRVDVVVNTAGIMPLAPIAQGDLDLFDPTVSARNCFAASVWRTFSRRGRGSASRAPTPPGARRRPSLLSRPPPRVSAPETQRSESE